VKDHRSTQEVFEDHLRAGFWGTVEQDIERNYAQDVVLLTGHGLLRGHDGLRHLAKRLRDELPECTYEYRTMLVAGEMAFLEWKAVSKKATVEDGADSYLIRDGRIVAQTVHYTISPA
jgi:hypothetical protein